MAALRRNLWCSLHTTPYGQYLQELLSPTSALRQFQPTAVLFAFEAGHLFGESPEATTERPDALIEATLEKLCGLWQAARENFGCQVIQQTVLPLAPALLGQNEHRLPASLRRLALRLNERLRALADAEGVDLLALDDRLLIDGTEAWHDPVLWHKAKQEVRPSAGAFYGELVGRLLGAAQGLSAKCLVLDLDNTLWGGVIGDDGLEGITLGQGSPLGEAFLAVQRYARDLSRRGVILAVCSKNDEANALLPFENHPDMILKRADIACFSANWNDKPANLREIARQLNIGLDSLVFLDDNPFERNIVRRELPMVAVPELPEDPTLFPAMLANAGYFEALHVTGDDLERTRQYQDNLEREQLRASSTDLAGYLSGLQMEMTWGAFDRIGLQRIVQLLNKTNQFNLRTRRYLEPEVLALMDDPRAFTLQLRLTDRFGDNGVIGLVIGLVDAAGDAFLDTWLMSCRVLGRGVEQATLQLVVAEALRLGASRLVGEYLPTAKNGMVADHYGKMGFTRAEDLPGGGSRWHLPAKIFTPEPTFISLKKA